MAERKTGTGVRFNVPAAPATNVYLSERFMGADFTSEGSTVDETKSPNVENMIRSVPGKIRKRMGYYLVEDYRETIYGVHHLSATDSWLVHAGDKIYNMSEPKGRIWSADTAQDNINVTDDNTDNKKNLMLLNGQIEEQLIFTGMAEHRSVALELDHKLIILDGTSVKFYKGGEEIRELSEIAYIPTLLISCEPQGGSPEDIYEPLNLLQPKWNERFIVVAERDEEGYDPTTIVDFHLSTGDLDNTPVRAWVMDQNGDMIEKFEGTDFTVNRQTGVITFVTAPGATPLAGEDNVWIQASKTIKGYADRINHCTIGTLFGVNGASDRLFLSGNSDKGYDDDGEIYSYGNWDFYSQIYDPTYFGDTWYGQLGTDASAIMGYSIINNYLAAHKDGNELAQSIMIRSGNLIDGEASFRLENTLQGGGAISKYCFSYLATEPVFLTKLGIYAVTAQDVTGEKYAQDRSYFLEGKLLKEPNLENAFAYTWKDYYILCVNGHCYILDGLQPIQTSRERPYSTRQYVGWYFTNVPASCMFEINDELYFGSSTGKIFKWYTDDKNINSYSDYDDVAEDHKTAIHAIWETADISEKLFYKNKSYRYLALRCMPEIVSSVLIEAQRNGLWEEVMYDTTNLKYFSFANVIFSKFTFSTNQTQKVTSSKARLKKLDHVRFRFSNHELNEPIGINDFAVEYRQSGNHK